MHRIFPLLLIFLLACTHLKAQAPLPQKFQGKWELDSLSHAMGAELQEIQQELKEKLPHIVVKLSPYRFTLLVYKKPQVDDIDVDDMDIEDDLKQQLQAAYATPAIFSDSLYYLTSGARQFVAFNAYQLVSLMFALQYDDKTQQLVIKMSTYGGVEFRFRRADKSFETGSLAHIFDGNSFRWETTKWERLWSDKNKPDTSKITRLTFNEGKCSIKQEGKNIDDEGPYQYDTKQSLLTINGAKGTYQYHVSSFVSSEMVLVEPEAPHTVHRLRRSWSSDEDEARVIEYDDEYEMTDDDEMTIEVEPPYSNYRRAVVMDSLRNHFLGTWTAPSYRELKADGTFAPRSSTVTLTARDGQLTVQTGSKKYKYRYTRKGYENRYYLHGKKQQGRLDWRFVPNYSNANTSVSYVLELVLPEGRVLEMTVSEPK